MSKRSTIKQIFINGITGWSAILIRSLIGVLIVPFLIKNLGVEGFGLVGLLAVVVSFSEVADLGLRTALARELSEKVARHDENGFRTLSSTALILYLGLAFSLITIGWVFAPNLVSLFKVGVSYRETAILLLRIYGGCSVLLSFIIPVFTSGLASFARYDLINWSRTASQIFIGLFLFLMLSLADLPPLYIWAGVMLSGAVFNLLMLRFFYAKICFSGQLGICRVNLHELGPLFSLGWKVYILQLTNALSQRIDPLIVSRFFSTPGVALYHSAQRLILTILPLISVLSTQLTPFTTRYHVNSQHEKQKKMLFLSTRYTLTLGVLFYASLLLFADIFSRLWLFDSLGEDCLIVAKIMRLSSVVCLLDMTGSIHFSILMAKQKLKFAVALNIPFAIFNVLCSIYFVGYTRVGIIGVFIGTILSSMIRRPLYIWYVSKVSNVTALDYLKAGYFTPVTFLAALLIPGFFLLKNFAVLSWGQLFLGGVIYVAYAGVVLLLIERDLMKKMVQKVVR